MKLTDREWLPPAIVALLTFGAFLPALKGDFSIVDDGTNLVFNEAYRGLGWKNLTWMFTTLHAGHFRPLTWLTFGVDYLLWGMNPAGYLLTNLLLHVANAVLFYFLCKRLLAKASPSWQLPVAAAFAALLFSLHPVRVEVVAWPTNRKDLLAGFFFLLTIYAYLRANADSRMRWRWMGAALGFYVAALLSKATAITLPAVLLILDYYPLGRFRAARLARLTLVWEKAPFVLLALPFAWIALHASASVPNAIATLAEYTPWQRLLQALHVAGFYVWKTLLLYDIPPYRTEDLTGVAIISTTIALSVFFWLLRKRWPAGLTCWLFAIVVLSPVIGIAQRAQGLTADRYLYLTSLSFAALAGGALAFCSEKFFSASRVAAAIGVIALGVSTWRQSVLWQDDERLMRDAVLLDLRDDAANFEKALPRTPHKRVLTRLIVLHTHWQRALTSVVDGDLEGAQAHYEIWAALRRQAEPERARLYNLRAGVVEEVEFYFRQALARKYQRAGNFEQAVKNYRLALAMRPSDADTRRDLVGVSVLIQTGYKNWRFGPGKLPRVYVIWEDSRPPTIIISDGDEDFDLSRIKPLLSRSSRP